MILFRIRHHHLPLHVRHHVLVGCLKRQRAARLLRVLRMNHHLLDVPLSRVAVAGDETIRIPCNLDVPAQHPLSAEFTHNEGEPSLSQLGGGVGLDWPGKQGQAGPAEGGGGGVQVNVLLGRADTTK